MAIASSPRVTSSSGQKYPSSVWQSSTKPRLETAPTASAYQAPAATSAKLSPGRAGSGQIVSPAQKDSQMGTADLALGTESAIAAAPRNFQFSQASDIRRFRARLINVAETKSTGKLGFGAFQGADQPDGRRFSQNRRFGAELTAAAAVVLNNLVSLKPQDRGPQILRPQIAVRIVAGVGGSDPNQRQSD